MKRIFILLMCGLLLVSVFTGCVDPEGSEQDTTTGNEEESYWISPELSLTDEFDGNTLTLLVNREMDASIEKCSKI